MKHNAKKWISMLLALVMVLGLVITPAPVSAAGAADAYISDLIGYYKAYQEAAETDILRTLEEMAKVLRLPRSTINYRLKKAKAILKKELEDWYFEDE